MPKREPLRRLRRRARRVSTAPGRVPHALRHAGFPRRQPQDDVFSLDLHTSVIADAREPIERAGLSLTEWTLSATPWVTGRCRSPVAVINEHTWRSFEPAMVNRFQRLYGRYLRGFRGFVATYPPCFSLLYRDFDGPTLAICATRYEHPFTQDADRWRWLNAALQEGIEAGWLTLVANNRADADYLANYTGVTAAYIPSSCAYTKGMYSGSRDVSVVASFGEQVARDAVGELKQTALPLRKALGRSYGWDDLYDCRALILIPYNVSTMTLFEAYTACMPIYVPSKKFLKKLTASYPGEVMCHLSFSQVVGGNAALRPSSGIDLNDIHDPSVLEWYLDRADFYSQEWMPEMRQFESWTHLDHLLATDDQQAISERMKTAREDRQRRIRALWCSLGWLNRVLQTVGSGPQAPA